jgi:hypothetical protein
MVVALLSCGGSPATAFEGDDEGWRVSGNGEQTVPQLNRAGGNPGGHICVSGEFPLDTWYFVAPQKFLGEQTRRYGGRLTFDLKQGSTFNQIRGRDVVLNGGGLAVIYNMRSPPRLDWTPYSIDLSVGDWLLDTDTGQGMPASEEQLRTVLSRLNSLRIRGEFVAVEQNSACLDNVVLGQ